MNTQPLLRSITMLAVLALAAGCAGSGGASWTYSPPAGSPPAGASGSPGPGESPGPGGTPGPSGSPGGSPAGSPGGSPPGSPGGSPPGSPGGSPGASPGGSPGGSPGASPSASVQPSGQPSPGTSPQTSPGGSGGPPAGGTFDIEENAKLEILKDGQKLTELTVAQGGTYTFRVTNTANFPHNFFIGSPEDLEANNKPELQGIDDFNSGTQEFTYTFEADPATLQFACTVPGHYPLMNGNFNVGE